MDQAEWEVQQNTYCLIPSTLLLLLLVPLPLLLLLVVVVVVLLLLILDHRSPGMIYNTYQYNETRGDDGLRMTLLWTEPEQTTAPQDDLENGLKHLHHNMNYKMYRPSLPENA